MNQLVRFFKKLLLVCFFQGVILYPLPLVAQQQKESQSLPIREILENQKKELAFSLDTLFIQKEGKLSIYLINPGLMGNIPGNDTLFKKELPSVCTQVTRTGNLYSQYDLKHYQASWLIVDKQLYLLGLSNKEKPLSPIYYKKMEQFLDLLFEPFILNTVKGEMKVIPAQWVHGEFYIKERPNSETTVGEWKVPIQFIQIEEGKVTFKQ